jgi:GNAT superfamily N-acetyltransferase
MVVSREFQISPAFPEDAEALTKLAFESKGYWGYPEHWLEIWRDQIEMTPEFIQRNSVFKAVTRERKLLGCAGLEFIDDKWILAGFWVKPEIMGKGIGNALYQKIMKCAREEDAQIVQWESDPNAVGFYERMGAKIIDEKVYHLDGQRRVLPIMAQTLGCDKF